MIEAMSVEVSKQRQQASGSQPRRGRGAIPRTPEEKSARRGTLLIAYGHTTVDFTQGAIAALMPFLVLQGGYSYSGAAGIMLTFSLVSSIIQPVLGIMGDRWRMRWLIPGSV